MPAIKPGTRGEHLVRLIARLDRENNETMVAYAEFIGEPPDYAVNQLIDSVLAQDKEFGRVARRTPESYVPGERGPTEAKEAASRRTDPPPRPRLEDATICRVSGCVVRGRHVATHGPKRPR